MKFNEIIDAKHWQNIQNLFSALIGVCLKTIDEKGEVIVRPSGMPKICSEIIPESADAYKKCCQWYPKLANGQKNEMDEFYSEHICPLGLTNFVIPVKLENIDTVYLIGDTPKFLDFLFEKC